MSPGAESGRAYELIWMTRGLLMQRWINWAADHVGLYIVR
jgi:hypothetical protein